MLVFTSAPIYVSLLMFWIIISILHHHVMQFVENHARHLLNRPGEHKGRFTHPNVHQLTTNQYAC